MKTVNKFQVEHLAKKFHEVYQKEAVRQGDVRHASEFEDLPENIKKFDRVLARYVLRNFKVENRTLEVCHLCGKKSDWMCYNMDTKKHTELCDKCNKKSKE